MSNLAESLENAVVSGQLLESSKDNILNHLAGAVSPTAEAVVTELTEAGEWAELNDRFYKTLAFGTGGLRGRTVGKVVTKIELGDGGPNERPEFPCVGSATMNFYNVGRAIRGMIAYVKKHFAAMLICSKERERLHRFRFLSVN